MGPLKTSENHKAIRLNLLNRFVSSPLEDEFEKNPKPSDSVGLFQKR